MMKIFLLLLTLLLSSLARENPFFPEGSALDLPLTTNQVNKAPQLKRATIKLPSTARVLQSISVKYKNLDGTISEKSIELDNSIDWHLPLFISQNYEINENKKVSFKKVAFLKFITFFIAKKKMRIVTKDKLIRNFLLVKPHRIVCDFKRNTNFRSYVKNISSVEGFKKINIGTHNGYYRVVIELDGYYKYKINHTKKGYLLGLF